MAVVQQPESNGTETQNVDNRTTSRDGEMTDPPAIEAVSPVERFCGEASQEVLAALEAHENAGRQSETSDATVESSSIVEQPTSNGSLNRPKSASSTTSTASQGGARSSSAKFASLRAAFEQRPASSTRTDAKTDTRTDTRTDVAKRRLVSSEKQMDRVPSRNQGHEAEIAKAKHELEKERELRVAFEEKITGLEDEIDVLNSQLEERNEVYESRVEQLQIEAESRLNAMAIEARSRREECSNLLQQLFDLKRSVSTSTRTSPQVSDTTFRQEMEILQHEVQNWVVNNFRRARIELSSGELREKLEKFIEPEQLERLRPIYGAFEMSAKLPIYQATVACYMMEIFDEPFLFGLQGHRDWARRLKQGAEGLSSVLETGTYHRWRANTFDTLRQAENIKGFVESAANGIAELICITLNALTNSEDSETRLASLKTIVHRTISLAHLIRVQQAQYAFVLPSPMDRFDSSSMDDISDETDTESERTIRCATFPSITKTGDADGDQLDEKHVLVRAKVLCNENASRPSSRA